MQYRFYLDGTLVAENAVGWDQMILKIQRDKDLKAVLLAIDGNLTFTHDGYEYIKNIYDTDGSCEYINVSIHRSIDDGQNFIERYKGILFIADMKFDEFNCSVLCKLTDDSFYAKIDNRRNTKLFLTGNKTVNDLDITPCTVHEMSLFDPATAVYGPILQPYGCFRVFDALQYLIANITDNDVEFESPLFGPSGDYHNLMLTYGFSIRQTGNSVTVTEGEFNSHSPQISFQSLFSELNKRLNIGFYVDRTGAKPKVVIDYWKELFRDVTVTTFPDLPNLKTEIAKDEIYVAVTLGGNKSLDLPAAAFPGDMLFLGFKKEELSIAGKCNSKNVLDLSYDFISDTNIIEQILVLDPSDETYDKDWFLIECNTVFGEANQSNWLDPAAVTQYYNEGFTNSRIAENYYRFIPNSIAQYLGGAVGDARFEATLTVRDPAGAGSYISGGTSYTPIKYNNEILDPSSVYNNGTYRFTAPANGAYSFYGSSNSYHLPNGASLSNVNMVLNRYTAGLVLISTTRLFETTRREDFNIFASRSILFIAGTKTIYCNSGEIVELGVTYAGASTGGNVFFFSDTPVFPDSEVSTFRCTGATGSGGILKTYDPNDYPVIKHLFTTEITQSQTDAIELDPLSLLEFYIEATNSREAWIDDLSINEFTGTINAKLLSARNEIGEQYPPDVQQVHFIGSLEDNPFALDILDRFGNPTPGNFFINRVLFYEVGKVINVSIPATHMGAAADTPCIIISEEDATITNVYNFNTLTAQLTIRAGFKYKVRSRYVMSGVGNTFFQAVPQIVAPTVAGGTGSATIGLILPASAADYTFLWSTGATTQGITEPAGDYTCQVTYVPGTFDTNVLTFFIQIPISETGE